MMGDCDSEFQEWQNLLSQIQFLKDLRKVFGPLFDNFITALQFQADQHQQAYMACMNRNLRIYGVEQTQAIQFWVSPQGQGSRYAPPNSVPMVSKKPTMLRVYVGKVNRTMNYPIPTTIAGTLTVTGQGFAETLNPTNGPITAKDSVNLDRGQLNDTLNFNLGWSKLTGTLQFSLRVFDPANPGDYDSSLFSIQFDDVPTIPIGLAKIHYTGVDYFDKPVDAEPDFFDVLLLLADWLDAYPMSSFFFDDVLTVQWSAKLAIATNFQDLYNKIGDLRAMSGTSDLYLGFLPDQCGCGWLCGLGGGGYALFFRGDALHEIGHALGRAHTPGCNAGGPDPNYPQYANYPRSSIGEYGVDITRQEIYDPNTINDIMSYCPPASWLSPYTYLGLKSTITQLYQ